MLRDKITNPYHNSTPIMEYKQISSPKYTTLSGTQLVTRRINIIKWNSYDIIAVSFGGYERDAGASQSTDKRV